MKTWKTLSPRTRKLTWALAILAVAFPAPIAAAVRHTNLTALALVVATLLFLRSHPSGSHRTLTAARIPAGIATAVTGHKPTPAPERTVAHAPVNGPAIPLTNPTR